MDKHLIGVALFNSLTQDGDIVVTPIRRDRIMGIIPAPAKNRSIVILDTGLHIYITDTATDAARKWMDME